MEELRTLSRSSSNGTKILEQDPEAVKIAMQARRVSWGDVCVQIGRRTSTNLTNLNNPFMKEGTQSAPPGGGMSSLPEVDDGEEGDAADSGPPLTPHSGLSKLDGLDGSRRPLGASPEAGTPPPSTPPGGPHYADAAANDLNSSIHSTISTMTLTGADDDFEDDEPSPWHPSMAQELEEEDSDADSDADSEDSLEGAKAVGGALAQAEEAKASTPPATESVSRESTPPRMSPSRARTPPGPAGASTVSTE